MPIVAGNASRTPPKRATPRKPAQTGTNVTPADLRVKRRAADVNGLFQMAAAACIMKGAYADAGAINMHAPKISEELAKLADQNEQVSKLLDYLTAAGPYSGIIVAVLPLALQLAANHERINPDAAAGLGGVLTKADLEAHVKAEIEKQRTTMLQEIKAAQDENKAAREALSADA
jgi:hypothetical protein